MTVGAKVRFNPTIEIDIAYLQLPDKEGMVMNAYEVNYCRAYLFT